jgi:hypothetical protein
MAGAAQLTLVPGVMPEKKTDRRSSHRDNAPMKSSRIFSIGIVVQWTGPKYNYTAPVSSFGTTRTPSSSLQRTTDVRESFPSNLNQNFYNDSPGIMK